MIDEARASGFRSVNLDLIYGLPLQTLDSFNATLDKVLDISPERIALYSYAHLPALFKPQRRIKRSRPAVGGSEAADPHARHRPPDARGLPVHRHGSLRQARRRARRGAAPGPAAAQLPGLLDAGRQRHARLRRVGDRQRRAVVLPEREEPERLLRRARRRAPAGVARHRADRGRPGAARGDPGADLQFPPVAGIDRARLADRFPQATSPRKCRTCGASPRTAWSSCSPSGSWSRPRAGCWCASVCMVFDRHLREQRRRASYSKVI